MNRKQAVTEKIKAEKYLEYHKLRPLFHQLTKYLLLKKPEDPIQFLIDYFGKRNKRQVICVHGYDQEKRIKLAKNISIKFNFKLIQLAELFKGTADWNGKTNKQINDKVISQLIKVQSVYKGIVISGYPANIVQTDFIQKSGILPERYFLLQNNQEEIKLQYQKKYEGNVEKMIYRNRLQLKQFHEILHDQFDYLPENIEMATEVATSTIGVKANRKIIPDDSIRVCVLYPPFLKPEQSAALVNLFLLNPISVNESLRKLSNKPEFVVHVESQLRKHKQISKQIQLAMIEAMAKSVASKNKGYVLYGWPYTKCRLPLLKEHFLNPHLIFIFDEDKQKSLDKFNQLDDSDSNIFLVNKKPTKQEYLTLYQKYQDMVDELKGNDNVHIFKHQEKSDKILSTFLSLIDNTKIYS